VTRALPALVTAAALAACGARGAVPLQDGPAAPSAQRAPSPISRPSTTGWKTVGPIESGDSGKLNAVVADPSNPNVLYVGGGTGHDYEVITSAGVYKSTNGGANWKSADNGLTDRAVNDLWIDPANGQTLVAATEGGGLFRTTNGGASWTNVWTGTLARQVIAAGAKLYAATADGVVVSTNTGASWSLADATAAPVNALTSAGSSIYAGCIDGRIFKYSGGRWVTAGALPNPSGDDGVHALAADPASPSTVYASRNVEAQGVFTYVTQDLFVTKNAGGSWKQVPFPPAVLADFRGSQVMAFSAVEPHLLYVGGVRQYSFDGTTFTQQGSFGDERSIRVLPGASKGTERIWVGSDQGAWYTTAIGDTSPQSLTRGLSINVVRAVALSGANIATTIQDFTPAVSANGGGSWAFPAASDFYEDGDVTFNPARPNDCAIDDYVGYDFSTDGCTTFTHDPSLVLPGFPSDDNLEVDARSPSKVYLATTNGVYRSTDYGATMNPTSWNIPTPAIVRVDPKHDANIFVVGSQDGTSLYVSHDGGTSWAQAAGFPSDGIYIQGVAIDPQDSNTVIAAGETYGGAAVYRSTDGGATFALLNTPIVSSIRFRAAQAAFARARDRRIPRAFNASVSIFPQVNALAFDPAPKAGQAPALVLSTTRGIVLSRDDGATWTNIGGNALAGSFEGVDWDGGNLFVATDGQGVIYSQAPASRDRR
jgi:hypothetical protein